MEASVMKRMPLMWLPAVACLVAAISVVPPARHGSAQEPSAREREIDELIARLGNESFEVREEATRRLKEREEAAPMLRRALRSADAEVARRVAEILESFARRQQDRARAKVADLAKGGAVDRAVEQFVRRAEWDDESPCWRALADLAGKLDDRERQTYGKASRRADERFRSVDISDIDRLRIKFIHRGRAAPRLWERRVVLREEEIEASVVGDALFAVSGNVKIQPLVNHSTIFSSGSVDLFGVVNSLVVCDGDFTARDIVNSLIIARGTIRHLEDVRNSRIITCGEVQDPRFSRLHDSQVVEKEPKPLGFVKFFDPADVGLRVAAADGGARVTEAARGQRFAAGLRADDLITAVNGKAVKDAEAFRRLLRTRLAVPDEEMVFTVRRAGKALEVRVPGKE
jgi:hypothetical protein